MLGHSISVINTNLNPKAISLVEPHLRAEKSDKWVMQLEVQLIYSKREVSKQKSYLRTSSSAGYPIHILPYSLALCTC